MLVMAIVWVLGQRVEWRPRRSPVVASFPGEYLFVWPYGQDSLDESESWGTNGIDGEAFAAHYLPSEILRPGECGIEA